LLGKSYSLLRSTLFTTLSTPDDALLPGVDCRLRAVYEVQLLEDVADMGLDGAFADDERFPPVSGG
jgi:hypothetical protein